MRPSTADLFSRRASEWTAAGEFGGANQDLFIMATLVWRNRSDEPIFHLSTIAEIGTETLSPRRQSVRSAGFMPLPPTRYTLNC